MFGTKLENTSKFCNTCGTKIAVSNQQSTNEGAVVIPSIAIPLHLKMGLIKKEAHIFLFNSSQTALIYIGNDEYKRITASGNKGGGYFQKVAGMMSAFKDFAISLELKSIQNLASEYPGSIIIDNSQIKKIRIYQEYDKSNEMYVSEYTLELDTTNAKYKGTIERGVDINHQQKLLKNIFGKILR